MGWGAIAGAISAPLIANAFGIGKKGNTTVNQVPLQTPEQYQANKSLLDFANTGTFGNFTAGTPYTGSFGNFSLTDTEQMGLGNLNDLLQSGMPESFKLGTDEIAKFLNSTAYDPNDPNGLYSNYKKTSEMNAKDSLAKLKQNLSFNKNLAGSDTVNQFGDFEHRNVQDLNNALAAFQDQYIQRRLGAIPLALQAGQAEEGINQGRISAAYQYGGLERSLQNLLADKQYQEFIRQRGEQGMQLQALQSVAGSNTNWGVPSVSMPQSGSWDSLLNLISQAGGYGLGMKLAG